MPLGSEKEFLQSESCTSLERACVVNASIVNTFKNRIWIVSGAQKFAVNSSPDIHKYKYKYNYTGTHVDTKLQINKALGCYFSVKTAHVIPPLTTSSQYTNTRHACGVGPMATLNLTSKVTQVHRLLFISKVNERWLYTNKLIDL